MEGMWHWVSSLEKKPSRRSVEDLDIILSKLKTLKVFECYPERVLQELSRYVLYESFLSNHVLYKPGEEGDYWYAVISGKLEMFDVDPGSSKSTSICCLQGGDSFGENVIFGTSRQTMVETKSYCELLYVEAAHIRRIYQAHKSVMAKLIRGNSADGESQLSTGQGGDDVDGKRGSTVVESDLVVAGMTLKQLISHHFSDLFSDHQVNMFTYRHCCSGRRLVDWVLSQSSVSRTRIQAVQMWQALLTQGVLQHVLREHAFRDDPLLYYQFTDMEHAFRSRSESVPQQRVFGFISFLRGESESEGVLRLPNGRPRSSSSVVSSPRSSRSSLSSLLDECFDTITQLGPEVLLYAALGKDPPDRSEEELELVYEELLNLKALRHLSSAVKQEIAACVKLEHFKKSGKFLFRQGDKGDSWYIILRGSVNVIIQGKGVVCTLHEGDEFGKLSVVNEGVRSASIQTRESNCYFLRIERTDFRRILFSVESATMKLMEHGRQVMMLHKATLGRYHVVKGTPDKMLDHLTEADSGDDLFAEDFFLTYPVFMKMPDLCKGLLKRFKQPCGGSPHESEQELHHKSRVAQVVSQWIRIAGAELVKDVTFQSLLREVQDGLEQEGFSAELKKLNSSLSESMRRNTPGHSSPSALSILSRPRKGVAAQDPEIRMGISTIPPCQPQDKVPLRVHTVEHTCCRLQPRLDTVVSAIKEEACQKLRLDASEYVLCEVKSSGEKIVLRDSDVSVHYSLSVNGRLFIVPRIHQERTVEPLSDQNQQPLPGLPEKEGSREIAAHLTLFEWNLFSNIQQMEIIYSAFGRHSFGKITANLDLLVRRFNEVQYWVVTELCSEPDLLRRSSLLRKFIKIAGHCKSFNNLNSFFAIVVGLMNGAVARLHLTWKELPPRLKRRFESFESLTDPSRNHKVLRAYQSKLSPPVIPFMPLIMKDIYFLQEGNETFVDGMVNFEKMRMVASKVRSLNHFQLGSIQSEVRTLSNKSPTVQQYIRNLRVVDNQQVLIQMSHNVETTQFPSSRPHSTAS